MGFRKERISTNHINLSKDMYDNVVTNVRATRSDKWSCIVVGIVYCIGYLHMICVNWWDCK